MTCDKDNFDLSAVMCIFTKRRASDTLFCQPAYSSPSYQRWKLRWEPSEGFPVESHKRRTGSSIKGHLFCLNFSRNTTRSLLTPDPSFGWMALLKGRFLPMSSKLQPGFHPFDPILNLRVIKRNKSKPSPMGVLLLPPP